MAKPAGSNNVLFFEHRTRLRAIATLVALSIVALAACGHNTAAKGTTTTAPGIATGPLADIPTLPGSRPAGPPSDRAGTSAQSFFVGNKKPLEVVEAYSPLLRGWSVVTPPHLNGTSDADGIWAKGTQQLEVSAAPAPTASGSSEVQYSLLLRPR